MIQGTKRYWKNYKTGKSDFRVMSYTDEVVRDYISQSPSVQGLYEAYRGMGKSVREAFEAVQRVQAGE